MCGHKYSMCPKQGRSQGLCAHSCLGQFISIKTGIKLSLFITSSSYYQLIQLSLSRSTPPQRNLTQVFPTCCPLLSCPVSVYCVALRADFPIIWLELRVARMILSLTGFHHLCIPSGLHVIHINDLLAIDIFSPVVD